MSSFLSFCRIPPGGIPVGALGVGKDFSLLRSRARPDLLVVWLTSLMWFLILSTNLLLAYLVYELGGPITVLALVGCASVITLMGPYVLSPRYYELTPEGIVVRRVARSFLIPYDRISEVKRMEWTWRHLRLLGSGGLYGFYGLFKVRGLGRVWMYVTDRERVVLIETKDGTRYALSPEDPGRFIACVKKFMEVGC